MLPPQEAKHYSWEMSAKAMCVWPVPKHLSVNLSCGYQEPVPMSAWDCHCDTGVPSMAVSWDTPPVLCSQALPKPKLDQVMSMLQA